MKTNSGCKNVINVITYLKLCVYKLLVSPSSLFSSLKHVNKTYCQNEKKRKGKRG